nr:hypothetical protein [Abalone asfa-like virus]
MDICPSQIFYPLIINTCGQHTINETVIIENIIIKISTTSVQKSEFVEKFNKAIKKTELKPFIKITKDDEGEYYLENAKTLPVSVKFPSKMGFMRFYNKSKTYNDKFLILPTTEARHYLDINPTLGLSRYRIRIDDAKIEVPFHVVSKVEKASKYTTHFMENETFRVWPSDTQFCTMEGYFDTIGDWHEVYGTDSQYVLLIYKDNDGFPLGLSWPIKPQ